MTFPYDVYTEMFIEDTWVDISTDVQVRNDAGEITVKRGRSNGASFAEPSSCDLELNNRDGKYSPRNPLSPYYGLQFPLGKNTPIRVGLGGTEVVDTFTRSESAGWGVSDTGNDWYEIGLGGTVADTDWTVNGTKAIHSVPAANAQRSSYYTSAVQPSPTYETYLDVSVAVTVTMAFTDVTGGAVEPANIILHGQSTTDYYLARVQIETDESVTLAIRRENAGTVIAGPVTVSGLTHSAAQSLRVRFEAKGTTLRARVWNAANAEPSTWDLSTTSSLITSSGFVGVRSGVSTGNTNASPVVFSYDNFEITAFRFIGEVSSLPPRWDASGNDAWTPIEAAGILRRLSQGDQPVTSGLQDYILANTPYNYWPLTEGENSTQGNSAIPAGQYFGSKFKFVFFDPEYQSKFGAGDMGTTTLPPALAMYRTGSGSANRRASAAVLNGDTNLAVDFVYRAVTLGPLWMEFNDYSNGHWRLQLRGDGTNDDVAVEFEDSDGVVTALGNSSALAAITDGLAHHVRFSLALNGGDTDWEVFIDGVSVLSGTLSPYVTQGLQIIDFRYIAAATDTYVALGHVTVWATTYPTAAEVTAAMNGYSGETAGRRIERLCEENSVPFTSIGDLDDTMSMGVLFVDYFFNQLPEIETTDQGILYESLDTFGLTYRTRKSLYNQTAAATLDYSANEVAPPFQPVDDDQTTVNDVFAQRREGGSFRATLETGVLSVREPPNGVGRYKDEQQVNCETDTLLEDIAHWLLHKGTLDEARYPRISVELANPNVVANAGLADDLLSVGIGDRLVVTDASGANIYDDISVIVLGYEESFSKFKHKITFNCVPASLYELAVYGDTVGDGPDRYDTAGSEIDPAVDSDDTSLTVIPIDDIDGNTLWTTVAGEFPFDIFVGGERMTVTNITSSTSPQTFTVTRSVNGVVKSHAVGTEVRLWKTPKYGL